MRTVTSISSVPRSPSSDETRRATTRLKFPGWKINQFVEKTFGWISLIELPLDWRTKRAPASESSREEGNMSDLGGSAIEVEEKKEDYGIKRK